jgi:hypothetical protein
LLFQFLDYREAAEAPRFCRDVFFTSLLIHADICKNYHIQLQSALAAHRLNTQDVHETDSDKGVTWFGLAKEKHLPPNEKKCKVAMLQLLYVFQESDNFTGPIAK